MNRFSIFLQDYSLSKFRVCFRQNIIYSIISATAFGFAGYAYVFFAPKQYVGDFSIVLAENSPQTTKIAANNPFLASLGQGLSVGTDINTQVAILKSSSVLMPVYASEISGKSTRISSYSDWVKKLKVSLMRGTKILEISYTDTNKNRITSVLNSLSNQYKLYSLKAEEQELQDTILFTDREAKRLRTEAEQANRRVDAFVLKYGIIEPSSTSIGSSSSVFSHSTRGQSNNRNYASPLSNNSQPYSQSELSNELLDIEKSIFIRSKTYTSSDPELKLLKRKRDALKDFIAKSAGGIVSNLSLAQTNTSPTDVYLKYQALKRESDNLNSAYNQIETTRTNLNIQKNEINRPWELISAPFVNPAQVWPRPVRITLFSTFFGFLLGLAAGLFKQYKSDSESKVRFLEASLPLKLLASLPENSSRKCIDLLAIYISSKFPGSKVNVYADALTTRMILDKQDNAIMPFKLKDWKSIYTDSGTEPSLMLISDATDPGLLAHLKNNLVFTRVNLTGWIWLPY